ncbi:hypothetical protein HMI56_006666 [Coelomomyces lativittatus]|nr:hypothetical protein HMI56_006666 [Coelomomyces lativittatus]
MLTTEQSRFFSTSVQLLLTNWFALKTAVEQGWGGRRSNEKAHAFIQEIIDLLLHQGSKGSSSSSTTMLGKINEFELQAFIEEVMNTEFCCLLEDDSAYLVFMEFFSISLN